MSQLLQQSFSSELFNLESEDEREIKLLRVICKVAIILGIMGVLSVIFTSISTGKFFQPSNFTVLLFTGAAIVSYQLSKRQNYRLGSLLIVGLTTFCAITIIYQTGTALSLMIIVMLPILLAVVLMETRAVLITTFLCLIGLVILFVIQDILKIYTAPPPPDPQSGQLITEFFCTLVIIPTLVAIIVIPFKSQTRKLQEQNTRLAKALERIEAQQQANQQVGQQVLSLSAQLKSTAGQQASSSREQMALVTQVGATINELSTTSAYIAESAQKVSISTDEMAAESQHIEQTTALSVDKSQQGKDAVNRSIAVTQEVSELYQQLRQTLSDLNTRSSSMRRILDLLSSISSQTHLLAMNAAIEAAGAGEMGARFKVVAQEVKNLANRSNEANQEVLAIVQQIEQATLDAVKSVEDGYQKAQAMGEVVQEAGAVIEEMRLVSEQAQNQATIISKTAHQVRQFIETIKAATGHQHTSSQQVLEAITGLTIVAQHNTEGSNLISSTAVYLEDNSRKLNFGLLN